MSPIQTGNPIQTDREPQVPTPARVRVGRQPWGIEKAVVAVTMLGALGLALTGFMAWGVLRQPLTGLMLLGHVALGGLFVVGLAVLALLWADACRFGVTTVEAAGAVVTACFGTARKVFFWAVLLLGVAVTLTMLLSMVPLFGSDGLRALNEAHRWCAVGLVLGLMGLCLSR